MGYLEQNGSWKRGRKRWRGVGMTGYLLPTTTRKAHVNYSVIKSLCLLPHNHVAYGLYLPDGFRAAKNKISLLWRWPSSLGKMRSSSHFTGRGTTVFHWNGQVKWTTPACRSTSQHIRSKGEHGAGKDKSIRHELLPATWVCVSRQGHTAPDAWLRSQGIQQDCLVLPKPGSILKAHTIESSQRECLGLWSRTQIAAEFTLDSVIFPIFWSRAPVQQATCPGLGLKNQVLGAHTTAWPRLGTPQMFLELMNEHIHVFADFMESWNNNPS